MKYHYILLLLSTDAAFLLLAGQADGGVAPLCKKGEFYDKSKQEFVSCQECIKTEQQECLQCCATTAQEVEGGPTRSTQRGGHVQTEGTASKTKQTPPNNFLPNILVVSGISAYFLVCLLILVLVIIQTSTERNAETEATSDVSSPQLTEVVTEEMLEEPPTVSTVTESGASIAGEQRT